MGETAEYTTIADDATAEISDRRSVFRCTLRRCESVDGARDVVGECRARFRDARHHCSAAVIGPDRVQQYRSDDGEPAGTAGEPMLQTLLGAGVSDVVAVVTRWFGGTLLGTGGLVRAYSGAVHAALDNAAYVTRTRRELLDLTLAHADAGRIEAALRASGVIVVDTAYADAVILRLATADPDAVRGQVAALTSGSAQLRHVGSRWVDQR